CKISCPTQYIKQNYNTQYWRYRQYAKTNKADHWQQCQAYTNPEPAQDAACQENLHNQSDSIDYKITVGKKLSPRGAIVTQCLVYNRNLLEIKISGYYGEQQHQGGNAQQIGRAR